MGLAQHIMDLAHHGTPRHKGGCLGRAPFPPNNGLTVSVSSHHTRVVVFEITSILAFLPCMRVISVVELHSLPPPLPPPTLPSGVDLDA
jgi:hypothetical protein